MLTGSAAAEADRLLGELLEKIKRTLSEVLGDGFHSNRQLSYVSCLFN